MVHVEVCFVPPRCARLDRFGVEPGLAGTAVIGLAGSVAIWRAALAIPQVDAWLHAGG